MSKDIPFAVRAVPEDGEDEELVRGGALLLVEEHINVPALRVRLVNELTAAVEETRVSRIRDVQKRRALAEMLRTRGYLIQVLGKLLSDHTLADLEQRILRLEEHAKAEVAIC